MVCDGTHRHAQAYGRAPGGGYRSRRYQTYPSRFCRWLADIIVTGLLELVRTGAGPTGHLRSRTAVRRITAWSTRPVDGAPGVHFLNEMAAHGRPAQINDQHLGHYLHVDDGLFIGPSGSEQAVDELMEKSADGLQESGFLVRDRTPCAEMTKVLGYEVNQKEGWLALPLKKMLLLQESMRYIVSQATVDVRTLSSLVGLWIWGALLRRDLLAIPKEIFRFMSRNENRRVRWWRTVRGEVATMAEAVLFMKAV